MTIQGSYTFTFQKDLIHCKLSPHKQEAVLDTFFIDETDTITESFQS